MKNACYELIEPELEHMSIGALKSKSKENKLKKKKRIQGLWNNYRRCNVSVMAISEEQYIIKFVST